MSVVGRLMYLMVCTRPDIAYAVSIVSRDQRKHVDVDGFIDENYAKDPNKDKSITGLRSVVVNCDNKGAIHLSRNAMFHERTKHINVRYQFIREIVEPKEIEVAKIGTKDNAADAFTRQSGAIVELDLQTAISLSSLEVVPPWSLGALIDDIRTWSRNLQLTFSWINQVSNQMAHWTAHFALSSN
uniref:Retrovirus-related Pol polyprotein from transposon TNT 1-94 n=1 Tax=Tanacetum cinerariifolium TaxID=118510 RepID=A0A6L2LNP3_TANCI|nr:retrovirus-related Pol polyprotein from transposon TNT 1-94 [Tanacetum cinerariifolium]